VDDEDEDYRHLQCIWMGEEAKCFLQNNEGKWVSWKPHNERLDFAQDYWWSGWRAVRIEGDDFITDWVDAAGETYSAGTDRHRKEPTI